MSRFKKLSHSLWYCHYHIVWVPKYRYRVLQGDIRKDVSYSIKALSERMSVEVVELNIQPDHVHLLAMIPPKIKISDYLGTIKGRTATRIFAKHRHLKEKPYWGNKLWARGYCVDTVGLDEEKIRKYVKFQEQRERRSEQGRLKF